MSDKLYLMKGSTSWISSNTFLDAEHWKGPLKNFSAAQKLSNALEKQESSSCSSHHLVTAEKGRGRGLAAVPYNATDRVVARDTEGTGLKQCGNEDENPDITKPTDQKISGKNRAQCPTCWKTFSSKDYLKIHARVHSGERPYSCNLCDFSCSQKSYLNTHIRLHSEARPYTCSHCPSTFKTSSCLRIHLMNHRGEKPHKCEFCGKGFVGTSGLKAHLRTHTGEKPFCCDVCKRSFQQKTGLKRHKCDPSQSHEKTLHCKLWKSFSDQWDHCYGKKI